MYPGARHCGLLKSDLHNTRTQYKSPANGCDLHNIVMTLVYLARGVAHVYARPRVFNTVIIYRDHHFVWQVRLLDGVPIAVPRKNGSRRTGAVAGRAV